MDKFFHQILESVYFRFILIPRSHRNQQRRLQAIRKRNSVNIAFLMSSLPMWRFQGLYDLLKQDSRFQLLQAIYPFPTFSKEQKESAVSQLLEYCENRKMSCIDLSKKNNPGETLKSDFNPDVIFYPQPYNGLFFNDLDSNYFSDRLICYIPYAMLTAKETWAYRSYLSNIAWRLYYPSEARKQEARRVLYNNGRNIRVVGESTADLFSKPIGINPWKAQEHPKKRVIWAPHYSIVEGGFLHRDSFTWLSETMWEIAQRFQDQVQFAFKPHPRLKSVLYELPSWGNERTDAYYALWASGSNTQLESGNYIDLFKTSDAMVHDSSSFSVEYHYTGKPVLFITEDVSKVTDKLNDFGRDAILAHYLGKSANDVIGFINDVVLGSNDPMLETRRAFREEYLAIPSGKSVAENIYQDLLFSLDFEK